MTKRIKFAINFCKLMESIQNSKMCGRVMCRLDPSVIGPMRFLPVAYNPKGQQKKTAKQSQAQKVTQLEEKKVPEKASDDNSSDWEDQEDDESLSLQESSQSSEQSVKLIEESKEEKKQCEVVIEAMQWGLYRPGSKDLVINGRFEELVNKPMFRGLLERKRAILTVNGYYEWDETSNPSKIRPYLIKSQNEEGTLFLACLYNNAFKSGQPNCPQLGDEYNHFVVLTMDAGTKNLARIHHRMPVFLQEHEDPKQNTKALWLDPNTSFATCFEAIMKSKVYEGLTFYEVGELVNSIKHDNPEIIMPRAEFEQLLHKRGLGKYFTSIDTGASQATTTTVKTSEKLEEGKIEEKSQSGKENRFSKGKSEIKGGAGVEERKEQSKKKASGVVQKGQGKQVKSDPNQKSIFSFIQRKSDDKK